MHVRDMTEADVSQIAALADVKRTEYATYSPVFWRKSDTGTEAQTHFFANHMLPSETTISLMADTDGSIEGFIIGMIREAPPVYDPGGPVCWIDDFTVAHTALWTTVGVALYQEVTKLAGARGAVAMVTVSGHRDASKRAMLSEQGGELTVETYVQPLQQQP